MHNCSRLQKGRYNFFVAKTNPSEAYNLAINIKCDDIIFSTLTCISQNVLDRLCYYLFVHSKKYHCASKIV